VYEQEAVRKAYWVDGKSEREIARELGFSRNTVSRLLKTQAGEKRQYQLKQAKPKPTLGQYEHWIAEVLAADEQAPRKQRHTARRIYERLKTEFGYTGSERGIRGLVAQLKKKQPEVFLPLAFQPGEMAQVDWAEVTVNLGGQRRKFQLFCMVLNHSGALYCQAFERANQEAFFEGHTQAFQALKGVPRTITYDNLTSAVKKILQGKNRDENERFVTFRSAWLFDSRFCNPARGNEKGRVENMVKFAERNFFVPVPVVSSLEELNEQLKACCQLYLSHTQARQTQSVGERWLAEQAALLPLPHHQPECCRIVSLKANQSALVQFETNRYSVPVEYAYSNVWVKAFIAHLEIIHHDQVIAVHTRLPGRFQESIRFEHYRKALERKPGGLQHLRSKNKEPLPIHSQKVSSSRFPQVYVRPPDLTQYRQLLRNS
jgi:transposase